MTYRPRYYCDKIVALAHAWQSSLEIAEAINDLADEGDELRMWREPAAAETAAVLARAWDLADPDETTLAWGATLFDRAYPTTI